MNQNQQSPDPARHGPDEWLVTPAWLEVHRREPNLLLVDARQADDYARGHLPGAVNLPLLPLTSTDFSPAGVAAFRGWMEQVLSDTGVGPGVCVVFYERISDYSAARGVWLLHYLGHADVHLLDGGLEAWVAAGGELVTETVLPRRREFRAGRGEDNFASREDVLRAIDGSSWVILDVRTVEEYTGERVRAQRGGAIPGAVHLDYTENLTEDGRFRSPAELAALYGAVGLQPDQQIITYCQGGFRAALSYLALRRAGFTRVRNYASSWAEWGNRPELPVAP